MADVSNKDVLEAVNASAALTNSQMRIVAACMQDTVKSQQKLQEDMIGVVETLQDAANTVKSAAHAVSSTADRQVTIQDRNEKWMQSLITKALQNEQKESEVAQAHERKVNWKLICAILAIASAALGAKAAGVIG